MMNYYQNKQTGEIIGREFDIVDIDLYTQLTEQEADLILNEIKQDFDDVVFFESEKAIALNIEEDYRLRLADISDVEMREVKEYIRVLKPDAVTRSIPNRPEIMNQYEKLSDIK
ncbi:MULTISPECIES: hypothetical protein [unclassified Aliivibrio]|uniref:hypothetical protein n=1 Tax=unclassified Aliivibrio TaxID=2645654 RepID=UPI000A56E8D9|nr:MULTISPECIES: hypothetical protein [unclassified Aliivibrio]